jgi:hypothetical protein
LPMGGRPGFGCPPRIICRMGAPFGRQRMYVVKAGGGTAQPKCCPFLALSKQQVAASCGKPRHKAKLQNARFYGSKHRVRQAAAGGRKPWLVFLFPATNQEVASSSLAGRTIFPRHFADFCSSPTLLLEPDYLCMANCRFVSLSLGFAISSGLAGARPGLSCFCICWRPSRVSPVPAARVPWSPNPCVKQQLLILNRSRKRSPNLRFADRLVAGLCAVLMRPRRLIRSAIVLKPSALLSLHRALTTDLVRRDPLALR